MKDKDAVKKIIGNRVLVLDGATGTEFQKRGIPPGVCPEIWCLDNPSIVSKVHENYKKAGSSMVYTCTFGGNAMKLDQYGISRVFDINCDLALLAKKAVGNGVLVAGDIGPTGKFVDPFGDLSFDRAVDIYKEQVRGLLEGGVDCLAIETIMDIQEARAALIAIRELTDTFTIVTMTFEETGHTLNGTDPVAALVTLQSLGADAVGCNCSTGPAEMVRFIEAMRPYAKVPLVAKPNAGMPQLVDGETLFTMTPSEFALRGRALVDAGASLVGGCCGTEPDHIRALSSELTGVVLPVPQRNSISAVSSARRAEIFDSSGGVCVIGERINPTGKKALQAELKEGKWTSVRTMAAEQEKKGARLLDVNVGMPGIVQREVMKEAIRVLSTVSSLPLVIDSSDVSVMEAALRLYPGRALINSISGEAEKLEKLLPLASRYGAMFILLPLTDGGVPETAEERKRIVEAVFKRAEKLGFSKEDIVVDGLVMTVSANSKAPGETLETIDWASNEFKCNSVVGLSNVSFGLPERKWLNAAFCAMAIDRGLTMVIANPEVEEVMNCAVAGDVLSDRDKDAYRYIKRFSGTAHGADKKEPSVSATPLEAIFRAVVEGRRDEIEGLLDLAIEKGNGAHGLVQDCMVPAINRVGQLFERKEYFLPQLIAGAETMKEGVAHLEPFMTDEGEKNVPKGRIVMATVEGDVHDIGKNIVALLMRNHGFEVIDLGKDVSNESVVKEIERLSPSIVGLSALMTTTMVNMEKVINSVRERGNDCDFLLGGAVVTRAYAESLGAYYAKDGVEAVAVSTMILNGQK